MVVLKNASRFSEHVIWMGRVLQPSTAAQLILIYMIILGVSKDGDLQLYGQTNAWTDAEKHFLYKIKSLEDTILFSILQVTLVIC